MERKSLVIGPRTRQDILKGKHIRKYDDGGDNFDDYWTDSDDASSSISKDSEHFLELPNETFRKQSSIFHKTSDDRNSSRRSRAVQSPLKPGCCHSPLKPGSCQSPLKPRNYQSPKSRGDRSGPKSTEVLPGNILNVNEISTEFQDMTINHEIDENNPETEALNRFSGNVKNNLPPKLSSITSEIQSISNSSLTKYREEYNESEMPTLVSKISFKTSKKSISRSTKKDPKIREVQMQFDELDEKIMQMVCVNDDIQSYMASEEEMSMTEQSSFVREKKKHEIEHVFKNIEGKENCSDIELDSQNESSTRSIKKTTRSLSQSINDSESMRLRNMGMKKSENTSECQKDQKERVTCQEKSFIRSQCIGKKSNSISVPQHEKISSETFISKKNLRDNSSQSMDVLVNSGGDESRNTSEQNIEINEIQNNEKMALNKSTVTENDPNSPVNPLENTNDFVINEVNDSSEKISKQQGSLNPNSHFEKNKSLENSSPRSKAISSNNENISKSAFSDVSETYNTSDIDMVEKQKAANEENDVIPDKIIYDATSFNHTQAKDQRKSLINKIYNSTAEQNDSIEKDEIDIEKTTKKLNKIKNNKTKSSIATKCAFMSDKDIETADLDGMSQLKTCNRQKIRNSCRKVENYNANTSSNSLNSSANNISEVIKTSKKQKKSVNKNSQTKNKKHAFSSDDDVETADLENNLQLKTSNRQKTRNSSKAIENDDANISLNSMNSSVNSICKVNTTSSKRRKKSANENSPAKNEKHAFLSDEDVETADLDSISLSKISNKHKTRNSSRAVENNDANTSSNFVNRPSTSISGVDKASKKQKQSANKDTETKNKKSDVMPDKTGVKTTDIDSISRLQISNQKENKKNENNSLQKADKKKRNSSMLHDESIIEAAVFNDSPQHPTTKRQKTSVEKRNSLISQENVLADVSINSPEKSFNNVSKKETTKIQDKIENNKISKSTVGKNNLEKKNKRSIHTAVRKSERKKYAPLAHWRNERLQWRFENGIINKVEVGEGTKEDIAFMESLNKLTQQQKKKKISKPKKARLLDAKNNKEKYVHLLKKFPLIAWEPPARCNTEENPDCGFLIKRMMESKRNCFGYIYINANKSKPSQYMPEEDLILIVIEGNLEISVQGETFILENKDMFIVPGTSVYSIKNMGKRRALLSYVVGKFNLLDSL